jgi:hypothetical protein
MNCLRSLEHCNRVLESHSRHGCLCVRLFCVSVILFVCRGLTLCWSPVQGVLPTAYRIKKVKKRPMHNKGLYSHNNDNSIQFFIIYVLSLQLQGQLQTQNSADTGNYIRDNHNIKSKKIIGKHWRKNTLIQKSKQKTKKQTDEDEET